MGTLIIIDGGSEPASAEPQAMTTAPSQSSPSFTIPGVAIGSAAAGRHVFIFVHYGNDTLVIATIAGIAATIHGQAEGISVGTTLISAQIDVGTTATVGLEFLSGSTNYSAFLKPYKVTGLLSAVAGDTATFHGGSSGATRAVLIDVVEDGILLAGLAAASGATGFTVSGVTEDYDSSGGVNLRIVGGSLAVSATETNRSVSFTRTGGSGTTFTGAIVAASFR